MVLSYVLMRLTGVPVPIPQFTAPAALVLALAFFVAALGEELGWSGYVIDPMQKRWGALPGRHNLGVSVGRVAIRAPLAGTSIAALDRLVISLHGGGAGSSRLAL